MCVCVCVCVCVHSRSNVCFACVCLSRKCTSQVACLVSHDGRFAGLAHDASVQQRKADGNTLAADVVVLEDDDNDIVVDDGGTTLMMADNDNVSARMEIDDHGHHNISDHDEEAELLDVGYVFRADNSPRRQQNESATERGTAGSAAAASPADKDQKFAAFAVASVLNDVVSPRCSPHQAERVGVCMPQRGTAPHSQCTTQQPEARAAAELSHGLHATSVQHSIASAATNAACTRSVSANMQDVPSAHAKMDVSQQSHDMNPAVCRVSIKTASSPTLADEPSRQHATMLRANIPQPQTVMRESQHVDLPHEKRDDGEMSSRAIAQDPSARGLASATVGHASVGHASVGNASVGHASVGHASVGHASVGHASVGNVSVGRATASTQASTDETHQQAGAARPSHSFRQSGGPEPIKDHVDTSTATTNAT